jgi:hypothetical protein
MNVGIRGRRRHISARSDTAATRQPFERPASSGDGPFGDGTILRSKPKADRVRACPCSIGRRQLRLAIHLEMVMSERDEQIEVAEEVPNIEKRSALTGTVRVRTVTETVEELVPSPLSARHRSGTDWTPCGRRYSRSDLSLKTYTDGGCSACRRDDSPLNQDIERWPSMSTIVRRWPKSDSPESTPFVPLCVQRHR